MLNPGVGVRDAKHSQQLLRKVVIRNFTTGVDIVDMAHLTFVQDAVEFVSSVASVQEPPSMLFIAMDEERHSTLQQVGKFWYDLCSLLNVCTCFFSVLHLLSGYCEALIPIKPSSSSRSTHLMRPIDIVKANHDCWQFPAFHVRCDHHFCRCFGGGIRICGLQ